MVGTACRTCPLAKYPSCGQKRRGLNTDQIYVIVFGVFHFRCMDIDVLNFSYRCGIGSSVSTGTSVHLLEDVLVRGSVANYTDSVVTLAYISHPI